MMTSSYLTPSESWMRCGAVNTPTIILVPSIALFGHVRRLPKSTPALAAWRPPCICWIACWHYTWSWLETEAGKTTEQLVTRCPQNDKTNCSVRRPGQRLMIVKGEELNGPSPTTRSDDDDDEWRLWLHPPSYLITFQDSNPSHSLLNLSGSARPDICDCIIYY